jgi:hypothetical protein
VIAGPSQHDRWRCVTACALGAAALALGRSEARAQADGDRLIVVHAERGAERLAPVVGIEIALALERRGIGATIAVPGSLPATTEDAVLVVQVSLEPDARIAIVAVDVRRHARVRARATSPQALPRTATEIVAALLADLATPDESQRVLAWSGIGIGLGVAIVVVAGVITQAAGPRGR